MTIDAGSKWAPPACTLPIVERPRRVAEFDEFFAGAVLAARRVSPTRLELMLTGGTEPAGRELAARETACCSFFVFGFADAGETTLMSVQVPAEQVRVLEGLGARVDAATDSGERRVVAVREPQQGLRSGAVAAAVGVNVETLRYYERRGLLREPARSLSGHRLYPPEAVTTLRCFAKSGAKQDQ